MVGDDRRREDVPVSDGGDPACWLGRACPDCGFLDDGPVPPACPRCGRSLDPDGPEDDHPDPA